MYYDCIIIMLHITHYMYIITTQEMEQVADKVSQSIAEVLQTAAGSLVVSPGQPKLVRINQHYYVDMYTLLV